MTVVGRPAHLLPTTVLKGGVNLPAPETYKMTKFTHPLSSDAKLLFKDISCYGSVMEEPKFSSNFSLSFKSSDTLTGPGERWQCFCNCQAFVSGLVQFLPWLLSWLRVRNGTGHTLHQHFFYCCPADVIHDFSNHHVSRKYRPRPLPVESKN